MHLPPNKKTILPIILLGIQPLLTVPTSSTNTHDPIHSHERGINLAKGLVGHTQLFFLPMSVFLVCVGCVA